MIYEIEKPEKGAGIAEYLVKYITLFVVFLISLWAISILVFVPFSPIGLTLKIYTLSFGVSLVIAFAFLMLLLSNLNQKIKQGVLYRVEFLDQDKIVKLFLYNDFKDFDFIEEIPYSNLVINEKPQKIEIKSELKMKFFNQDKLLNSFNIAKTPWTKHPQIVDVVNKFRLIRAQ